MEPSCATKDGSAGIGLSDEPGAGDWRARERHRTKEHADACAPVGRECDTHGHGRKGERDFRRGNGRGDERHKHRETRARPRWVNATQEKEHRGDRRGGNGVWRPNRRENIGSRPKAIPDASAALAPTPRARIAAIVNATAIARPIADKTGSIHRQERGAQRGRRQRRRRPQVPGRRSRRRGMPARDEGTRSTHRRPAPGGRRRPTSSVTGIPRRCRPQPRASIA